MWRFVVSVYSDRMKKILEYKECSCEYCRYQNPQSIESKRTRSPPWCDLEGLFLNNVLNDFVVHFCRDISSFFMNASKNQQKKTQEKSKSVKDFWTPKNFGLRILTINHRVCFSDMQLTDTGANTGTNHPTFTPSVGHTTVLIRWINLNWNNTQLTRHW